MDSLKVTVLCKNRIEFISSHLTLCVNTFYSMSYLDSRLNDFQTLIDDCAPASKPVMLLLDNINLYHGNRRHHRLFNLLGPKMWNFTVRGLLIPNVDGIEDLFNSKETAEEPQRSLKEVKAQDTFIGRCIHSFSLDHYCTKAVRMPSLLDE